MESPDPKPARVPKLFRGERELKIKVVKNANSSLAKLLSETRGALCKSKEKSTAMGGYGHDEERSSLYALQERLTQLHDILLVVLEAAELPEARASLIEAWRGFIFVIIVRVAQSTLGGGEPSSERSEEDRRSDLEIDRCERTY
jgi:hypothetical protein